MRTWPGLAAIGAGLVHLGIAAGSTAAVLVPLVLLGAAEVLWGVLDLARPDASRPRAALGGLAATVAVQVVVLLTGVHEHVHAAATTAATATAAASSSGAVAGGAVLDLIAAAALALRLRRGSGDEPGPARFLLGAASAAAVVAVVAASSLAGTAVGAHHVH